jgi:uncharacterized protein (DUF302 family)
VVVLHRGHHERETARRRDAVSHDEGDHGGIITKDSPYTSVSETLERLEEAVRRKGLRTFALVDHSGEAERAGLRMPETKLLIFGSPEAGTPLMVDSPLLALDLPLKVLVWEDRGRVRVSYNATSYLVQRYDLPSELAKNIAGIDALVDGALRT